ncbi:MAG: hypothetical protein BWX66_01531 [Deltaproteobacteria bacterium ADurb.Bin058]|nr:MAG: hypothetical protein BWX66_01531 [Deltaproteobacteria bacterium ADurb.Bin058]
MRLVLHSRPCRHPRTKARTPGRPGRRLPHCNRRQRHYIFPQHQDGPHYSSHHSRHQLWLCRYLQASKGTEHHQIYQNRRRLRLACRRCNLAHPADRFAYRNHRPFRCTPLMPLDSRSGPCRYNRRSWSHDNDHPVGTCIRMRLPAQTRRHLRPNNKLGIQWPHLRRFAHHSCRPCRCTIQRRLEKRWSRYHHSPHRLLHDNFPRDGTDT